MKTIILFCCLFVCVALAAIDSPANLRVSAISHEGFTARWDAVTSATSYGLEVVEGTVQNVLSNNFESGTVAFPGINWFSSSFNFTGPASNYAYNGPGGCTSTYTIASYLRTPQLLNPRHLTFYAKAIAIDTNISIKIEYSNNNADWTTIKTISADGFNTGDLTTTYKLFSLPLYLSGQFYIRWYVNNRSKGTYLMDNISIEGSGSASVAGFSPFSSTNLVSRVSSLSPNTTYSYRVMALNASSQSDYSPWQTVQTTAPTPGNGSSTSIGGAQITIPVPPVSGISNNDVLFDPDSGDDADISVAVESGVRTLDYTLTCATTSALNGSYTIHHEGFIPTEISVSSGNLGNVSIGETSSTFTLSGLAAKGSVIVTLGQDETLPVQLSSFLVSSSDTHAAVIKWQTASETGVNGYVILRSDTDDIQDASIVSPLINASNTSTQQSYQFTDESVLGDSWYWLMVRNIDGSEELFGPRIFKMLDNNEVPEFVFNNALLGNFPNPFNPATQIVFSLKARENVSYRLFNVRGQLVLQTNLGPKEAGKHQVIFEGLDANGKVLSSGMYILEMHLGKEKHYQKMMLQK